MNNRFIRDAFASLGTAVLAILLSISIVLRSPRLGLIAFLPNVLPLLTTLAYLHLVGFSMNAGNVIVFAADDFDSLGDNGWTMPSWRRSLPARSPTWCR